MAPRGPDEGRGRIAEGAPGSRIGGLARTGALPIQSADHPTRSSGLLIQPPRNHRVLGALVVLSAIALAVASCTPSPPPELERSSIVLVMIDTLRADGLESAGAERGTAPKIAALAERGVRFTNLQAASPWTGPSVSAILTGRYPDELGMHDLRDPLPASAITIAQRLQEDGYLTGAVISNAIIGPAYGHDKGYDYFHCERYKGEPGATRQRPVFTANKVTDQAVAWLEGEALPGEDPFFLYVHYTDPHDPYLPPDLWRQSRIDAEESEFPEDLLLDGAFTRERLTPAQVRAVRAHYDAEISFVDHEVGRLLESLPPDTLILLTSDHGEEFREHGGFLHGHTLFQELLHVPLIIAGPGVPAKLAIEAPVSHVDIAPTLLQLAGWNRRDFGDQPLFTGRSLVPYLGKGTADWTPPNTVPVYSILEREERQWQVMRQGPWKAHFLTAQKKPRLFQLKADPAEKHDVAGKNARMVEILTRKIEEHEMRVIPTPGDEDPEQRALRERELRALGYVK
jgi:arylsulfatase A-like enzyme